MLKEVLVVEGKMDTVAIGKALEADTIETGGPLYFAPDRGCV